PPFFLDRVRIRYSVNPLTSVAPGQIKLPLVTLYFKQKELKVNDISAYFLRFNKNIIIMYGKTLT
ncbi:MAG: hypothetical protein J5959_12780, partial [Butyrivibrio sp.]|nr:hypothetical protein [Butyrivibrio sp.]